MAMGKSHGAVGSAEELLLAHGGAEGGDVGGVFVEAFGVGKTLEAEAVHPHAEDHERYVAEHREQFVLCTHHKYGIVEPWASTGASQMRWRYLR